MRLIDADALRAKYQAILDRGDMFCEYDIIGMLDNAPTIEPITNEDINSAINEGFKNGYEMAKVKFERPKGEWIPVSERLPKESNGRVLITTREGKVTTGKHSEYSGNWYIGDMAQLANRPPVAWMPLPEAYKEA